MGKMNTDRILQNFMKQRGGALLITDIAWNIVYRSGKPEFDETHWFTWNEKWRSEPVNGLDIEWEIAEKDEGLIYRVHSLEVIDDGEHWLVHHVYDISDYVKLYRDLAQYSHDWHILSKCQQDMIRSISDCKSIVRIVKTYLDTESAVLFIKRRNVLEKYSLSTGEDTIKAFRSVGESPETKYEEGEKYYLPLTEGRYLCCASGNTISGEDYALFFKNNENEANEMIYPLYFNVFKLFIENALLREKIVYDSEHDNLTGLFNKSKYNEMLRYEFPFYDSITVFYMDLNYLKRTNDTMGHDAGNRLIIKAANSLKAVASDDIYAFRIGGDEFILVLANADEEKVKQVEADWRKAVEDQNAVEPEIECVLACGKRRGVKPYDMNVIVKDADELMYKDKRAIKISRGEDPESR
ncbi:MAG: GGDEF domain-containing protein [Lachnospiraceae bacterium]|nr:GGDEF domain-containing protein [Lachnospiraceae bacterium]